MGYSKTLFRESRTCANGLLNVKISVLTMKKPHRRPAAWATFTILKPDREGAAIIYER